MRWTSDVDVAVESSSIAMLEGINEWNDRYYFWMENKHIGRMCITDYENPEAKTWGAWDKLPTYVDVYVPPTHFHKHIWVYGIQNCVSRRFKVRLQYDRYIRIRHQRG